MTNFTEAARAFEHLSSTAPEFFMEVTNDKELAQATAFLCAFDDEVKGEAPHPLDPLADALMRRIMAYEESLWPPATPAMELRLQMDARKLTQRQLANATGISQSVISRLRLAERPFTTEHAKTLGAFFGISPALFLGLSTTPIAVRSRSAATPKLNP